MGIETGSAAAGSVLVESYSGAIVIPDESPTYAVDLVAGHTYLFALTGSGDSPLRDPVVGITLTGSEDPLVVDDDGGIGSNALFSFTPETSGSYTLGVGAANSATGGFTVDIVERGGDTVPGTVDPTAPELTAPELTTGTQILGFIETIGDVDVYRVTLTAGQYYSFLVSGGTDGDSVSPLSPDELDTQIRIYDASGTLITGRDDIGSADLSSAISFQPTVGGTYYVGVNAVNAHDGAGYALSMTEQTLSELDPLDTIDWVGAAVPSNDVTVYFAAAGEIWGGVTAAGWSSYDMGRSMAALATWSAVSDLHFSITDDADTATFHLVTTESLGAGLLGAFNPPGEPDAGIGFFALDGLGWDDDGGLETGGYGFVTLVHEFGHGLGLAHPHDDGGDTQIMPGVFGPTGTYGANDLNQSVFTIMSYNDGWLTRPDGLIGTADMLTRFGQPTGPGALDIAVVQSKYGAVASATGNTVYTVPRGNGVGTFYQTIWDTGGTDTIRYNGRSDTRIDLTAATLDYTATGGGVVSYAQGIFGGFTIANGVVIENAMGGLGNDMLTGNAADNRLVGRGGEDMLAGGAGDDIYGVDDVGDVVVELGGSGDDLVIATIDYALNANVERLLLRGAAGSGTGNALDNVIRGTDAANLLDGGAGADKLYGGGGDDHYVVDTIGDKVIEIDGEGTDTVEASVGFSLAGSYIENLTLTGSADSDATGNSLDNMIYGNVGSNVIDGGRGIDLMYGGAGDDSYYVDSLHDLAIEQYGEGTDTVFASVGYQMKGQYVENLVLTGTKDINGRGNGLDNQMWGNSGANALRGGEGDDDLHGGLGKDSLDGGIGQDRFWFDTALGGGNVDTLTDFTAADDTIVLDHAVFGAFGPGEISAGAFRYGTIATTASQQIIYDAASGRIWYDADGNGGEAKVLFAQLTPGVELSHADFVVV